MAPKLYIFSGSPCVSSVLITADALGLSLATKEVGFEDEEYLSPAFLKVKLNPQHTVPTLVDDDGFTIWDSHAINAYLVGKYGKDDTLYPKDLQKRAVVDNRVHFESGLLFPLLRTIDKAYLAKQIKEVPAHLVPQIKTAYGYLETFLKGHNWTAGDNMTIADFSIISTISCLDYHIKIDPQTYPNITAWIKRAEALPCFKSLPKTKKLFATFFDMFK